MAAVKYSLLWSRVHWIRSEVCLSHLLAQYQAKAVQIVLNCCSFFSVEAVSAVPSCTRTVARARTRICLGSVCCSVVEKKCQVASSQFMRNLFVGHQFAIVSWTNCRVQITFSEIRGLHANFLDYAAFAVPVKSFISSTFWYCFVLTASSGLSWIIYAIFFFFLL